MSFTVVIPARFGSTRLPGKPLVDIGGAPMVQRVWEQARKSDASQVIIATDNQRVYDAASEFGATTCMTSPEHPSGTDRLQEVAAELSLDPGHIIVNVQGDEPLIPPAVINQVAENLEQREQFAIATLCEEVEQVDELLNPNIVKVVLDADGGALYFSRAPVPWPREAFAESRDRMPGEGAWYRHIGIYAYRTSFLHEYVSWPPAPAEQREQLEQLRALHNGARIHVATAVATVPPGVDTPEDLEHVRGIVGGADQ